MDELAPLLTVASMVMPRAVFCVRKSYGTVAVSEKSLFLCHLVESRGVLLERAD